MRKSLLASVLALVFGIPLPAAAAPPQADPPSAGIQILSDVPLPAELNAAMDARWASDDSIYLTLRMHGVAEYSLSQQTFKEVFPGASKLGGLRASSLVAASSQYVVVAPPLLTLVWKRPSEKAYREEAFEIPKAIDVWNDQILLFGARRDEKGEFGSDGAIAWRGSLDKGLASLRPVLYDVTGPGNRSVNSCGTMAISAARFLADGRFIIAPGIQPGINLYDIGGKLVRTWDTGAMGIDTDCASIPPDQVTRILASYPDSLAWINQRRTIDTLLPLRDGAALIVRNVLQGRARWEVKRLREDGSVQSLPLPIAADNERIHLAGDIRDGKILLLLYERRPYDSNYSRPRLIRIQLPE